MNDLGLPAAQEVVWLQSRKQTALEYTSKMQQTKSVFVSVHVAFVCGFLDAVGGDDLVDDVSFFFRVLSSFQIETHF